jgi:cytochrome bd-type quinol oxidase subunit 2
MNLSDPAFWSRWQFGFTLTYHYLFPQLTMGLAWFLVYWKWRALRTGNEKYNQAARFWAKIFGLNFAVGVVTGIPMEFQFGTNWADFVRPDLPGRAIYNPFWWLGLLIVAISSITLISGLSTRREMRAFLSSNSLIVGLLTTGGAVIFPVMLYSTLSPANSLTAYAVASSPTALRLAFIWWPVGFALATTYFVFISRQYAGKVRVKQDNKGP